MIERRACRKDLNEKLAVFMVLGLAWSWTPIAGQSAPEGYDDTPFLPGTEWRVHTADRPQPETVTAGKTFSDGAPPPSDAVVLFDGSSLSAWRGADGDAKWRLADDFMEVNRTGSIRTREEFGDFQLHLEWATPADVVSNSQGRGNSGVIIYGLYEVQVLDSFQNRTYPDGQAAAVYGQVPPLVNSSKPSGEWQTYDMIFEGPRWQDGELVRKASVTVLHNGVVAHHKMEYRGRTLHRQVGTYGEPHPPKGYLELQDHANPVRYRNIWIRELGDYDESP